MKKQFLKHLTLLFLSGALLFSCGRNKEKDIDLDPNTTSDNANAQSVSDDALKLSEEILTNNNSAKVAANSSAKVAAGGAGVTCATVDTVVLGQGHIQFTVTFSGTCSYEGKIRKGQLLIDLSGGTHNTPGSIMTITTSDYSVNGVKFSGKKTVTCVAAGKHNIAVEDAAGTNDYASITYLNGDVAKWKTHRTRTLMFGGETATITDNVYDISSTDGIGNPATQGINREGRHYVVNINSPIRINFNCFTNNTARYPTQGILEISPDGKKTRTVDYGSGACDNTVTVTVEGKSKEVNLSY